MIDPKELRIGAHVNLDNKRAKIVCLEPYSKIFPYSVETQRCGLPTICHLEDIHDLEPIPITEELLEELGFVNTSSTRRIVYTKGCEYDGMWAEVRNLKDRWEVFVSDNDWGGRIVVRYLHELEAFLYLTTKTELIKE